MTNLLAQLSYVLFRPAPRIFIVVPPRWKMLRPAHPCLPEWVEGPEVSQVGVRETSLKGKKPSHINFCHPPHPCWQTGSTTSSSDLYLVVGAAFERLAATSCQFHG